MVCLSYLCVAVLFCVCVACPFSSSPWWRGGGVAQVLPIRATPVAVILLLIYSVHTTSIA